MPYELKNIKEIPNPANIHSYINKDFRDHFNEYEKYHIVHYNMTFVPSDPSKKHVFAEAIFVPELARAGYSLNNSNVYWVNGIQSKDDLVDVIYSAIEMQEKEGLIASKLIATIELQAKILTHLAKKRGKRIYNK